jgi:spoIIIJ-associated protein
MNERSRHVEVSARSVDEAVQQALDQLGLSRQQVEIEVIKQGSRGLLGLLSEDAVVRVSAKAPPSAEVVSEPIAAVEEPEMPPAPVPAAEEDEVARLGADVLQTLMRYLGLRVQVLREDAVLMSQTRPDIVRLNIQGEELGVLIGRRGETLRDLQYLTCLLVSRRLQRWPNLIVDVEDYKSRREQSLIDLARRMADQVRKTAQPVDLEPMPAHERRIVHLALRDHPDVFTESHGQDDKRRVAIRPKQ